MKKGDAIESTFIVSRELYQGFINLFNDKNPLHTDGAFAKQFGFNDRVMHGNILGGFLSYFIGECLPVKNVIIHSQKIKYTKPVYENDALLLNAVVEDVIESVNVVIFAFRFTRKSDAVVVAKGEIQIGILK